MNFVRTQSMMFPTSEQGWCIGKSSLLPQMCPLFDSWTARHMWAEFACSLPSSEGFSLGTVLQFRYFLKKPVFNPLSPVASNCARAARYSQYPVTSESAHTRPLRYKALSPPSLTVFCLTNKIKELTNHMPSYAHILTASDELHEVLFFLPLQQVRKMADAIEAEYNLTGFF